MALTPLMLMAGQGLQENAALEANTDLQAALASYLAIPFLTTFTNLVSYVNANKTVCTTTQVSDGDGGFEDVTTCTDGLPVAFVDSLTHIFDDSIPVLANVIPLSAGISTIRFSELVSQHSNNVLGHGINSVYLGHLLMSYGYIITANEYINTAVNGETLVQQTFTSMDALITGNISAVNKFTSTFGQDLINTGGLYDFSELGQFGSPGSLVRKLARANLLTTIATELDAAGLDPVELQEAIADNPVTTMKLTSQKKCYTAFTNVTGQDLETILAVLGVRTSNISVLSDVFDIIKMFPNSYTTMTSLNDTVLENIFTGVTPSPYVLALSTNLVSVMPLHIATSNYAMGIALQQIKNIHSTDAMTIGEQAIALETNQGLDTIDSLDQPVPTDVTTYYKTTMGKGTAINGTYYLSDAIGTASGIPHTDNFNSITANILTLDLTDIEALFADIETLTNGGYTTNGLIGGTGGVTQPDPVSGDTGGDPIINPTEQEYPPGSGAYYFDKEDVINSAIEPALLLAASALPSNAVTVANDLYQSSIDQVLLELQTLQDADIRFATTYTSFDAPADWVGVQPSIERSLNFAANLHSYGKETSKGHLVEILEGVANSSRGGQAIVATMREGRNLAKLEDAGILADNKISSDPEVTLPGNISPSSY